MHRDVASRFVVGVGFRRCRLMTTLRPISGFLKVIVRRSRNLWRGNNLGEVSEIGCDRVDQRPDLLLAFLKPLAVTAAVATTCPSSSECRRASALEGPFKIFTSARSPCVYKSGKGDVRQGLSAFYHPTSTHFPPLSAKALDLQARGSPVH
ncbi:hypothetical protein GR702_11305 [Novosphingobium sp. FGD1]|uniref:Uncharacterized protein n=1 Tax=Novosphingobium silvae TaxID=2692619 RepID=A0A7X4K7N6_9SPHN|nr:hypothetical protein [Novosphingobium silvae]MYL98350.1 hypothetical protein [Novosphingobium silvae]